MSKELMPVECPTAPDTCIHCGSNEVLWDYFEEEYLFFCGHCMKELSPKEYEEDWDEIPKGYGESEGDETPWYEA